jgi:hypothetical protein
VGTPVRTDQLLSDVARLTGVNGSDVKHGKIFRLVVTSSDGEQCGLPIRVDGHRRETLPYAVNQIADSLLVDRKEIHDVLASGTEAQLRRHLSSYTQEQLKPLRVRSEHVQCHPFFPADPGRARRS